MSERETSRPDANGPEGPAIPDGGLGTAMPSWLQQPPAWKRASVETPPRELPPPDTSPIDPRTILEIDDLPAWLQAIAQRRTVPEPRVEATDAATSKPADLVAAPVETRAAELRDEVQNAPEPPMVVPDPGLQPSVPDRPWWSTDLVVGALLIAVVVTLVYVILAATGLV